jgi:hypothetical protein
MMPGITFLIRASLPMTLTGYEKQTLVHQIFTKLESVDSRRRLMGGIEIIAITPYESLYFMLREYGVGPIMPFENDKDLYQEYLPPIDRKTNWMHEWWLFEQKMTMKLLTIAQQKYPLNVNP